MTQKNHSANEPTSVIVVVVVIIPDENPLFPGRAMKDAKRKVPVSQNDSTHAESSILSSTPTHTRIRTETIGHPTTSCVVRGGREETRWWTDY